jgi:PKD repeat protein
MKNKKSTLHKIVTIAAIACLCAGHADAQIGTWAKVKNLAPDPNNGGMIVLTDGSIVLHTSSGGTMGDGTIWDRLTPDSTGSYINGTWSQIAPMTQERFSFSSEMLKNGNVYAAGGEYGTDGTQAGWHIEVYNPLTNVWTEATGTTVAQTISDGSCKLLDNGSVLQALVDVSFPVHCRSYAPGTNALTTAASSLHGSNESMWLKLPDNSVLMVDEDATSSERYIPALNQWVADGTVPDSLYDPYGYECGPGWMLPDGRAFFIGGTNKTAYYTPSGNNTPGTWALGPVVPNGYGMPDAPGVMMPNGHILFACSPQPTSQTEFATPTAFYEFDYLTNTYTRVPVPNADASISICQQYQMIMLPSGQVLLGLSGDTTSQQYYIYTPGSAPLAAGKPIINSIDKLSCTTFMAIGHGFNGISEGAAFGDENECDSNYPLFRFTSGGKVYYARSYDWNSAGVQRGLSNIDTAYFELPAAMGTGSYEMYAVANGIASDSVPFSDSIPRLSSALAPPSVCTGSAFSYTATSDAPGAVLTWTRPAVAGISNAAITAPQSSNPDEVLVNTTINPITVTYTYEVAAYGCVNNVNVSVVVNPAPTAAFTAAPISACILPDSVTFTNNSIAGTAYTWTFGDGGTSTAANPVYGYNTNGSYTVKLVASSACGSDSLTQAGYVAVTAPAGPTASGGICGDTALTFYASSSSSGVSWFDSVGNYVSSANPFTVPLTGQSVTYYAQDSVIAAIDIVGPATYTTLGGGGIYTNTNQHYLTFDALSDFTLISVVVDASAAGTQTIQLYDSLGDLLGSATPTVPAGVSTVPLGFAVPQGTGYGLVGGDGTNPIGLYRNNAVPAGSYPFTIPNLVSITGSDAGTGRYYFFYDWHVQGPPCISARTPVTAVASTCTGIVPVPGSVQFGIYPDPAASEVTVDIQDDYSGATVSLRDMLGQVLVSRAAGGPTVTLDVSAYTGGIYFVEVSHGGSSAVRKLVISK